MVHGYLHPNFVYGPDFELLRKSKDSYAYPVDGWHWYNESPIKEIIE